jgi:hypothetical protein
MQLHSRLVSRGWGGVWSVGRLGGWLVAWLAGTFRLHCWSSGGKSGKSEEEKSGTVAFNEYGIRLDARRREGGATGGRGKYIWDAKAA